MLSRVPPKWNYFFLSKEQTYRHCLKSSLSSPRATGFILDLKELTAEMRQQLKYSHTQAQNFSAPKSEIGHDHLSICSFFSSNSISYTEVSQRSAVLQQVLTTLSWLDNELQVSFSKSSQTYKLQPHSKGA